MSTFTKIKMDQEEIQKYIPHRAPFLFVDRVLDLDTVNGTIVAEKTLDPEESFFQGHFPEKPIMPGVLIIESLAQVGAIYITKKGVSGLKVLMGVQSFKFRRPVYPGDTMVMKMEEVHISAMAGKCRGEVHVNSRKCAEGLMTFSIFKEEKE
ncbi:3-hydroxyacyl-ACP dehydratase FabZ [bacterium]|nr:3-hydroxyacyl-ACP dehydratase FabZ [bacterium]